MAHYDIFRHHLGIKYPAYGHALWEPSPGDSSPAVEVGDVGFIREGRFYRLFNVLLPADDPSHENFGVPEYHQQLTLQMKTHISSSTLSPNNFCSARVASESSSRVLSTGPDSPVELAFWCKGKQGAVLSLPIQARCKNTIAKGEFGGWIIKHIDTWFAWARQLGLGIGKIGDIILVTGTHRTRSWTNVAFPGGPEDGQISLGANVASRGDSVVINWTFSHERNRGAVLNCGPNGELQDLLEDQCIFIRGFRVSRKFVILPRGLKAAAGPNPDPKGDDYGAGAELMSIPAVPEYQDPLHALLEYITEEAPHCGMALVHDDDLALLDLDVLGDDTPPETLHSNTVLHHLRRLKPKVHDVKFGPDPGPSSSGSRASANAETLRVATISAIFPDIEGYLSQSGEAITFTSSSAVKTASQRSSTKEGRRWNPLSFLAGQRIFSRKAETQSANEVPDFTTSNRVSGRTSGRSSEHAKVIDSTDRMVSRDEDIPANAGSVLMDRVLGYVARQSPGEKEKHGDRWLNETRVLIEQNQLLSLSDIQVIEERIAFAREMKTGLDSKWGRSKLLQAREYRKSAKSAYHAAKTASDRGRDTAHFSAQRQDASSEPEMSQCDRVTGVALSLCRIYLFCKDAFPTLQMKAEWGDAVWHEACAKTGTNPESFIPFEIFAEGNMKLFTETKKRSVHIVEAQYGFDTSHAPDSISRNATLSQALLSETETAFIYRESNPGGAQHHPYQHPALQKVVNITWFRNKDDDGVVFHEYFSPLSVPAIAFILTVIECCIDEWTDGTRKETEWEGKRFKTVYQSHISSLNDFWQHDIAQGADLFEHIRSGLLKEARKHAGVPPVPVIYSGIPLQEPLDAAHREDPPPYPDQGLQLPEINNNLEE